MWGLPHEIIRSEEMSGFFDHAAGSSVVAACPENRLLSRFVSMA
jgi:hypothetical protein